MIQIVLLGFGNVNSHLCHALAKSGANVRQIYVRNATNFLSPMENIPFTDDISKLMEADVYIMGVPDDAIAALSESLPLQNKLVVHTSGGKAIDQLSANNRRGVFYPLQTFSKQRAVDFSEIPICIEAEKTADLEILRNIGETLSNNVVEISSEKRVKLHLAAVFVNNFVNYLYEIGADILKTEELSFDLLKPLIKETALKIETLTPKEAQTGPAKRKDLKTIEKHLQLLDDSPYREFYELFTKALKANKQI